MHINETLLELGQISAGALIWFGGGAQGHEIAKGILNHPVEIGDAERDGFIDSGPIVVIKHDKASFGDETPQIKQIEKDVIEVVISIHKS